MRRGKTRCFLLVPLAAPLALGTLDAGCTDATDNGSADAATDSIPVDNPPDGGGSTESGDGGGGGVTASFRVAHASPDLGEIDVCFRPSQSASWVGPYFATVSPPVDAGHPAPSDASAPDGDDGGADAYGGPDADVRSEEHTSELQ